MVFNNSDLGRKEIANHWSGDSDLNIGGYMWLYSLRAKASSDDTLQSVFMQEYTNVEAFVLIADKLNKVVTY